jgi:hypothetical protein
LIYFLPIIFIKKYGRRNLTNVPSAVLYEINLNLKYCTKIIIKRKKKIITRILSIFSFLYKKIETEIKRKMRSSIRFPDNKTEPCI